MDKNAIKKYAIWARRELIARVSQRAALYEITAAGYGNPDAVSVHGRILSLEERNQRKALIAQIQQKGFEQVMEEIAYTWFNRFSALRFMEVNGYLPSHVRVFTDEENNFKPQIMTEAIHLEMDGLDMQKVFAFKDANDDNGLFKYLIITQCNALSSVLPGMFQKISDYTELLFPDNLLRKGSVVEQMVSMIPENNFDICSEGGQIEIIGWLYQYYISEKHEEVIDPLHGKVVKKEEVPAATQLFTTDWVVRYLIDNSVGRYWIERNPDSTLADKLRYYVKPKNGEIKYVKEKIAPQELSTLDPCVGSGHFLVYAFDVLVKIYAEYGYSEREAAAEIVKNNLYGLDIDGRAVQLAYFSVMMKARQYDRRFFFHGIQPHVHEIMESNNSDRVSIAHFYEGDVELKKDVETLLATLKDAKEYGSILQMPTVDFSRINKRFAQLSCTISIYNTYLLGTFQALIRPAEIMSRKYAVVATNPPYLNKYDPKLKEYILENYSDYKGDLFSVFLYRNFLYVKVGGYSALMTPMVWMFIQTYEKLRKFIIAEKGILTLIQMEYSAYDEATVPICSFVLRNYRTTDTGFFFKLSEFIGGMEVQRKKVLEAINNPFCGYFYETQTGKFTNIPGVPIAYWVSNSLYEAFNNETIADYGFAGIGMRTGDNARFLRFWFEVAKGDILLACSSRNEQIASGCRWIPYNKGGNYRKWYGNNEYVVDWLNDGEEIKANTRLVYPYLGDDLGWKISNESYYYRPGITWSGITSAKNSFRVYEEGFIFDSGANGFFPYDDSLRFILVACLNTCISQFVLKIINPTINTGAGTVKRIPVILPQSEVTYKRIDMLSHECVAVSKEDWDSFETSWDFKEHPFITSARLAVENGKHNNIRQSFISWQDVADSRFHKLKKNEEELNRIFINTYGLRNELTPEVEDKDVTIHKADLQRDIRSFISYAVGCMFGRYSLDYQGLVYAGGKWDATRYKTYEADTDAIIPICDDEYFNDDIVCRFEKFVEVVYGEESLEDNLKFIADALGGTGNSREVIRNYFINGFYADHLKVYQKRPIYWLFDSGKKNGFKCLVYMHRYQPDTIARLRTDYVHEQQSRYRTAMADLQNRIDNAATTSERVKLTKKLKTVREQDEELRIYEEKIHHLADQMIKIDMDDGVKVNYAKFQDVLAKIK